MTLDSTKLTKVKNAIIAKINSTISTHNSDSSAHSSLFNNKENNNNKVTSWSQTPSDTNYPSEKLTYDTLVSVSSSLSQLQTSLGQSYASKGHNHGNIQNGGTIGTTANLPLITTTNGAITTGNFGTSANTFAEGNHTHNSLNISDMETTTVTVTYIDNTTETLTLFTQTNQQS